jgi:hypothetical protein
LLALCPFVHAQSAEQDSSRIVISTSTLDTSYSIDVAKEDGANFIDQTATGASPTWYWNKQADGIVQPLMALDAEGRLAFFHPNDPLNPIILIDPSSETPSILIGGKKVLVEDFAGGTSVSKTVSSLSLNGTYDSGGMMLMAAAAGAYAEGNGSATGISSTAIGNGAKALADYASAYGVTSNASGVSSIAVGKDTIASADYANVFGHHAQASGKHAGAYGVNTVASGYNSLAVGFSAKAEGQNSMAIGTSSEAINSSSVALGPGTKSKADSSVAIGLNATATQTMAISMGHSSQSTNTYGISIGGGTVASGVSSNALGYLAAATAEGANAFGASANALARLSSAYGHGSRTEGEAASAYGFGSKALGASSIAIGHDAKTTNTYGIALGTRTQADERQIAIGYFNQPDSSALLMLGNGLGEAGRANALTVSREGKMTVLHKRYVEPTAANPYPVQEQALHVQGSTTISGDAVIEGNISIKKRQGDIWMGDFGRAEDQAPNP